MNNIIEDVLYFLDTGNIATDHFVRCDRTISILISEVFMDELDLQEQINLTELSLEEV